MKKQYINPGIKIVKLQTQLMQSASGALNLNGGTATEWGARRGSFDDEFDDE